MEKDLSQTAERPSAVPRSPRAMLRLRAPVGFGAGWGLRTGAVHKDRVTAGAGNPEGRESRWEASSGNGGAEGGCGRLRPHHRHRTDRGRRRPRLGIADPRSPRRAHRRPPCSTWARQSGRSPVSRPLTTPGRAGLDPSCRGRCPRDHIPSLCPRRAAGQEDRAWSSGLGSGLNSPPPAGS